MSRLDSLECTHATQPPHGPGYLETTVPDETPSESAATVAQPGSGLLLWLSFGITPTSLPGSPDEEAC
ncbi:MAG TPA: hypothetical protein VG013_08900 [Gemmataceae bacterium]|nr:hypothetical protein [Gemmataceae bacterium]